MLGYIWFCVMLRAAAPGADAMIARYNHAMAQFICAGLTADAPSPVVRRGFSR